jgi:AcrR family transcriptional regulator
MARKESITKQMLLDTAFQMTREEGMENVTTRRLADHAKCSTQPIFRIYRGMEELYDDVYEMAITFFFLIFIALINPGTKLLLSIWVWPTYSLPK